MSAARLPSGRGTAGLGLVQLLTAGIGATFLLVGVLGFVPGITTNFSDLAFAGHHSEAELLGLFQVSVLHNLVHLGYGLAGLAMARKASSARAYLLLGGGLYLAIWLFGLFVPKESDVNFVPLNAADDWLHLALGLGMLALGLMLSDPVSSRRGQPGARH